MERILADLEHAGLAGDAPLRVDDLVPYDQYHYEGTDAVDAAAELLEVKPDDRLLDVGSGLGGPARYLADRTGCRVTALELQPDLNAVAEGLTGRCGLDGQVEHRAGDILAGAAGSNRFDGLMSMLCFLHIGDRPKLFASCREALRPGARMYIEDYFARGELEPSERDELSKHVFCDYLPDLDTYRSHLLDAGFTVEKMIDMTTAWTDFVVSRLGMFRENREQLLEVHGADTLESLDVFYATVVRLFRGGRLGGVRFLARLDPAR